MALIFTAIIWNLGTWYLGIPCSSSHTLIGSIFGVGIAYMLLPGSQNIALNWTKVKGYRFVAAHFPCLWIFSRHGAYVGFAGCCQKQGHL